jgi:hypothetical protein
MDCLKKKVGLGGIKDFSTGGNSRWHSGVTGALFWLIILIGSVSKFGVAIGDYEASIFDAYKKYPWLNGIHIHSGSQGALSTPFLSTAHDTNSYEQLDTTVSLMALFLIVWYCF